MPRLDSGYLPDARELQRLRNALLAIDAYTPDSEWTHERCMEALEDISHIATEALRRHKIHQQNVCSCWEALDPTCAVHRAERAEAALRVAADDLNKAANQFDGLNPKGANGAIFAGKAQRARMGIRNP